MSKQISGLNPFAERFAKVLFSRWPDWIPHAKIFEHPDLPPGSLWVTIHNPYDEDFSDLAIGTYLNEVIVFFDFDHIHFDPSDYDWEDDINYHEKPVIHEDSIHIEPTEHEEACFRDAIEFIENLLEERLIIVEKTKGDKAYIVEPVSPEKIETLIKNSKGRKLKLRSWKGTYNKELDA
jgi:hypothetical protein